MPNLTDTLINNSLDSAFTDFLLPNRPDGISGADGCVSIELDNGKSLILWGDSFLGSIANNVRLQPSKFILGNTATLYAPDTTKSLYSGTFENPSSFIPVRQEEINDYWYWPGDGIQIGQEILVFMAKYSKKKGEHGPFAFNYAGCDFLVLDSSFQVISREAFIAANDSIHYGHAVIHEGNYLYVYGSKADHNHLTSTLHVMRVELQNNKLVHKRYWDGNSWSENPEDSKPIQGLSKMISEQFTVRKINNKIVLLNQDRLQVPGRIYLAISDHFQGPFGREQLIHEINEPELKSDSLFTYNAMLHPQIQKDGKMLISYNVNTFNEKLWACKASVYRPRFFWFPILEYLD